MVKNQTRHPQIREQTQSEGGFSLLQFNLSKFLTDLYSCFVDKLCFKPENREKL